MYFHLLRPIIIIYALRLRKHISYSHPSAIIRKRIHTIGMQIGNAIILST